MSFEIQLYQVSSEREGNACVSSGVEQKDPGAPAKKGQREEYKGSLSFFLFLNVLYSIGYT